MEIPFAGLRARPSMAQALGHRQLCYGIRAIGDNVQINELGNHFILTGVTRDFGKETDIPADLEGEDPLK